MSRHVRLAVHLGTVLVDAHASDPTERLLAVGETLALPVWMLGHAGVGEILLSSRAAHLVEGIFKLEPRTFAQGAGHSDRRRAYAVAGLGTGRAFSRFVGRTPELTALHDLVAQVEEGRGQAVGIVGEPGIGKSRLLFEFHRSLTAKRMTYLEGRCLSYGSAAPYLPLRDLLRHHCGILEGDAPVVIAQKVQAALQKAEMTPEEWAPYLLQLLGAKMGTERLAELSPEAIKVRTFEALRQMSLRDSRQRPLIIAVEDLQWIDQTSEEFFASFVESLVGAPILFLTTYRPGYRPPWIEKSYVTQIALHPLLPQDSLRVVHSALQTEQVPDSLAQAILAKAEGNPFFIEELARVVAEHDHVDRTPAVPETVQGVLLARMDRLPDETRRVLQTAAVLGRELSPKLLRAIWDGKAEPDRFLRELQRQEFLYTHMRAGEPVSVFKHALTQEVAYQSLANSRRQALHAAAGRALEAFYADRLEEVYDRLAYHYAKTVEAEKAIDYLTRCAEKAAHGYAHAEAVRLLQDALVHVERLPIEERDRCLLDLTLRQAFSISILCRFREVLELLLHQRERLECVADPLLGSRYYFRLGLTYSYLGDQEQATLNAQRAIAEAARCGDEATMGMAHLVMALKSYWSGHPLEGVEHGQQAVTLLEPTRERHWLGLAQWVLGLNHFCLGAFEPALAAEAQAEAIGEAMADLRLQGFAAWTSGWIYATRGDAEEGITRCQAALAYTADPLNATAALGQLGYAYLESDDLAQAISLLEQAVQQVDQFRLRQLAGRFKTLLSEAYLLNGERAKARELARQGVTITKEVKHGYGVALAQRALGQIDQAYGALAQAEANLHAALQSFTTMSARFEVGRTRLTLAELAYVQGDQEALETQIKEAHALFSVLQVPKYMERTAQLAKRFRVSLIEDSA